MSWNYRLVVTAEDETDRDITVCEVYYNDAGKPNGYVDTAPPAGSDIHEARMAYEAMGSAFRKPVLRPDEDGKLVEVDVSTERTQLDARSGEEGGVMIPNEALIIAKLACAPCLLLGVTRPAIALLFQAPVCDEHVEEKDAVHRARAVLRTVAPSWRC